MLVLVNAPLHTVESHLVKVPAELKVYSLSARLHIFSCLTWKSRVKWTESKFGANGFEEVGG